LQIGNFGKTSLSKDNEFKAGMSFAYFFRMPSAGDFGSGGVIAICGRLYSIC